MSTNHVSVKSLLELNRPVLWVSIPLQDGFYSGQSGAGGLGLPWTVGCACPLNAASPQGALKLNL